MDHSHDSTVEFGFKALKRMQSQLSVQSELLERFSAGEGQNVCVSRSFA